MAEDLLLIKAATIERCVARAREEYSAAGGGFAFDVTRQDAAILNIQRAYAAALDIGLHIIRTRKLGLPQSARNVFDLLAQHGIIELPLAESLKKMVGFRNIAVHDYQALLLPILVAIITEHLDEFLRFVTAVLKQP